MKGKRGKSGAIKTIEDLERHSPYRSLDRKMEESDNRNKLIAKMDPKTAAFARKEFAKLGLF